jgi:deoxyhypusine synthase
MSVPLGASSAVLRPSEPVGDAAVAVKGPNFDNNLSFAEFIDSYNKIGFQATSLGQAIDIVNKMVGGPSRIYAFSGTLFLSSVLGGFLMIRLWKASPTNI